LSFAISRLLRVLRMEKHIGNLSIHLKKDKFITILKFSK